MELRLLPFCRRWKSDHAKDTRADSLHDALDHAAFAGCVSSFEDNDDARIGRLDPLLELHKLNLQLEQTSFVFFLPNLAFAALAWALSVAVQFLALRMFRHDSSRASCVRGRFRDTLTAST